MRASLLGALGTVALALVLAVAGLPPLLVGVAALVAASFCGLVLAHAGAYVYHGVHPSPIALGSPCCGQRRAAQRMLLQVQRRPLLQVLTSLPAAFGLMQLAAVSPAVAKTPGTKTATKVFSSSLPCPCGGSCDFTATLDYDYIPSTGRVTRFKMTWVEPDAPNCDAEIEKGFGAFDFQCGNDQPCKISGGNVFRCPCGTTVQYVPLGTSTMADCLCANDKNKTAFAQGVCGAPISVEKQCDNFQWINLDFYHKVECGCPTSGTTQGDLTVFFQYLFNPKTGTGTISFDPNKRLIS